MQRGGKDEYWKPIEKQGPLGGYTAPLTDNAKKAERAWLKVPRVQEVT